MKKIFASLMFVTGAAVFAQTAKVLTLPEAVNYALENKADAVKARLDIDRAEARIKEVRASAYPTISANSQTTYNAILQKMLLPGAFIGQPGTFIPVSLSQPWSSTNVLQLQQVLFNQQVFTGLKAARTTREFYRLNAELTDEQVVERVVNAYYQVYQAAQMEENAVENLNLTNQTIKVIKGLYDAGLAKKIDYDRTVVARNNILAAKQQADNGVELAKNSLKFIIGMPMEQDIELPDDTFDPKILPTDPGTFDERTEVKLRQKQVELLTWQKKASQAEYYPTVALTGNYGYMGQGDKFPLTHFTSGNGVFWSKFSAFSLNINVPIFNGFATRSRIQQNQVDILKAEQDLKDTRLGLDLANKNALAQLENNLSTIEVQQSNVKLATEVLNNTRSNYQYGLATLNDILDAERDLTTAKNNLTNAKLQYKLAEVQLLKSQGKLKTITNQN